MTRSSQTTEAWPLFDSGYAVVMSKAMEERWTAAIRSLPDATHDLVCDVLDALVEAKFPNAPELLETYHAKQN